MDLDEVLKHAEPVGYGTSMHYPHCNWQNCTGCVPEVPFELPKAPVLDMSIFRKESYLGIWKD